MYKNRKKLNPLTLLSGKVIFNLILNPIFIERNILHISLRAWGSIFMSLPLCANVKNLLQKSNFSVFIFYNIKLQDLKSVIGKNNKKILWMIALSAGHFVHYFSNNIILTSMFRRDVSNFFHFKFVHQY